MNPNWIEPTYQKVVAEKRYYLNDLTRMIVYVTEEINGYSFYCRIEDFMSEGGIFKAEFKLPNIESTFTSFELLFCLDQNIL